MNKNSKRTIAGGAVACLVLTAIPAVPTLAAGKMDLAGKNRVETGIKIAKASWEGAWKDSKTAVLASGNDANLVDALAIAPLAYAKQAPILLSRDSKDAVDADTLKEIKDRKIEKVYLAAGTGVLSEKIEAQLKDAGVKEIVRLGGANRYETAKNINKELGSFTKVAVVNGEIGLADALSVASIAAKQGMAIAMTASKDAAPDMDLTGKTVYAIGGSGVLSDAVVSKMAATRLGGDSRYSTNAKVIEGLKADIKFDTVFVADGSNGHLVDSLTGSVLAAQTSSPIVLADAAIDAKQKEVLTAVLTKDTKVETFGGTTSAAVLKSIDTIINPTTPSDDSKDLKVESVTVLSLNQVKVSFDSKVTKTSVKDQVEKVGNYKLTDKDGDEVDNIVDRVELQDNGKDAIITFADILDKDGKYPVKNYEKYTLTIDSNIVGKDLDKEISFKDQELPTVTGMEVIGIDTIKVKFSEPMKPYNIGAVKDGFRKLNKDSFTVNRGTEEISVKEVQLVNDNKEANITVYQNLKDGEEVKVKVDNDVQDYAGYGIHTDTLTAKVKANSTAPKVVGFKNAEKGKVTLIFDEDIKSKNTSIDHKDIHLNNSSSGDGDITKYEISGKELKLFFGGKDQLPNGTGYITIEKEIIQDLWNNENEKITAKVVVDEDTDKPKVKKVEQDEDNAKKIIVTFSEDIDTDAKDNSAIDKDNYVLKAKDGSTVYISDVTKTDTDEVTLELSKAPDAGEYTLEVSDVEDTAGNPMEKQSIKVKLEDKDSVNFEDMEARMYDMGKSKQKIVVNFDDNEMLTGKDKKNSIEDPDMYMIQATNKVDGSVLKKNVKDFYNYKLHAIDGATKVEIELPYDDSEKDSYDFNNYKDIKVITGRLADKDGNLQSAFSGELAVDTSFSVFTKNVKATSQDDPTVLIRFKDKVDFNEDDIKFVAYELDNSGKRIMSTATEIPFQHTNVKEVDGNTHVTFEFDGDKYEMNWKGQITKADTKDFSAAPKTLFVTIGSKAADGTLTSKTENDYGAKLACQTKQVLDYVAPEVEQVSQNGADVDNIRLTRSSITSDAADITIKYTEELDPSTINEGTYELEDYDLSSVTLGADKKTVTIHVTGIGEEINKGFEIVQSGRVLDSVKTYYDENATTPGTTSMPSSEKTPAEVGKKLHVNFINNNAGGTTTDTEAPVITLKGAATIEVKVGATYTDLGATVSDNVDKDLVATVVSTVDTTKEGTYTITYSAADKAGNNATPVVRTVKVSKDAVTPLTIASVGGWNFMTMTVIVTVNDNTLVKEVYDGTTKLTFNAATDDKTKVIVTNVTKNPTDLYLIATDGSKVTLKK